MPGIYQVPEKIYLPCVRISGYIYHARISGIMYLERFTMCTYIRYATDELWIPSTSEFKSNKAWKNDHFSKNTRYKTFTCWHVCAKDNRPYFWNVLLQVREYTFQRGKCSHTENPSTGWSYFSDLDSEQFKTFHDVQMYLVHEEMVTYQTNGQTFADFCFKWVSTTNPLSWNAAHIKNQRCTKEQKEIRISSSTEYPELLTSQRSLGLCLLMGRSPRWLNMSHFGPK